MTVPSQANASAPPPAATNQAPLEASAQPGGRQSEQAAKAAAQPAVAQDESRPLLKRDNSPSQPAEALRQTPREADLKREAPQEGGESKQISQHSEASKSRRKAVQTKPRQSSGRLAARSSSAQDDDSPKRNDLRARRTAQRKVASDDEPSLEVRKHEAKAKARCGGSVVWMDKRNQTHRPGTPGYGRRPGRFDCRSDFSF